MTTASHMLRDYPLTAGQAAGYLQLSPGYLYNLICTGHGPGHVKVRRQLRFREADLERWLAARSRTIDAPDPWLSA